MKIFISILILSMIIPDDCYMDHTLLIQQINDYRISKKIKPLTYLPERQEETNLFAKTLVDRFAHGPQGDFYENIWMGPTSRKNEIFESWKCSPGHNKNMLEKSINYATVSIYSRFGNNYAVFRGYTEKKKARK